MWNEEIKCLFRNNCVNCVYLSPRLASIVFVIWKRYIEGGCASICPQPCRACMECLPGCQVCVPTLWPRPGYVCVIRLNRSGKDQNGWHSRICMNGNTSYLQACLDMICTRSNVMLYPQMFEWKHFISSNLSWYDTYTFKWKRGNLG